MLSSVRRLRERRHIPLGVYAWEVISGAARARRARSAARPQHRERTGLSATPGQDGCGQRAGERGCSVLVSWTVSMTHQHCSSCTPASPWVKAAAIDPRRPAATLKAELNSAAQYRRQIASTRASGPTSSSYSPPRTGRRRATGLLTRSGTTRTRIWGSNDWQHQGLGREALRFPANFSIQPTDGPRSAEPARVGLLFDAIARRSRTVCFPRLCPREAVPAGRRLHTGDDGYTGDRVVHPPGRQTGRGT